MALIEGKVRLPVTKIKQKQKKGVESDPRRRE